MADTKKPETAGGEFIRDTLERLRDRAEDEGNMALVTELRQTIHDRMQEALTGKPVELTHYATLDRHLMDAHARLRTELVADPKSEEKKKLVEEAAHARRLSMELQLQHDKRVESFKKKEKDEHEAHHKHEQEENKKKSNEKWGKYFLPVTATTKWIFKDRLWNEMILGKDQLHWHGWNPLTMPSRTVQFIAKAVPEHLPAAGVGALAGLVMGNPVAVAGGIVAFPAIQKFAEMAFKSKQSAGGSHGGGEHH